MQTIRTLIVDDEPLARRGLELRLACHDDIEIVGTAGNGREAFALISELRPQLMFLDVEMPGVDGFDLLRSLPPAQIPLIVFVTAYDHYAIPAFSASALDYLLKPVDDDRLADAIARVRDRLTAMRTGGQYTRLLDFISTLPDAYKTRAAALIDDDDALQHATLTIRDGYRSLRIDVDTIRWIDAAGDYMCIHTADENHIVRGTMQSLERRLQAWHFVRIHRSTIVNPRWIREMKPHLNGEYRVTLDSGHELKLSRGYRDRIGRLMPP